MKEKPNKIPFTDIFVFFTRNRPSVKKGSLLINGKIVVFVVCSVISALINLIFISNLTKSPYTIGTVLSIPAAIFLGVLSVGLDLSKMLHVVQVNTLNELYRKTSDKPWSKKIKKLSRKWFTIYCLYVVLSIITSVSLSTISIGEGIHRNKSIIDSINKDIVKLEKYYNTDSTATNIEFSNMVSSVANSNSAITTAQQVWSQIESDITAYRSERDYFTNNNISFNSTEPITYNNSEIIPNDYWIRKNNEILSKVRTAGISLTLNQIRTTPYATIQLMVKEAQEKLTKNSSTSAVAELSQKAKNGAKQAVRNLNGRYQEPSYWSDSGTYTTGVIVEFDEENLSGAIDKLRDLKVKYENDSGDIGSSSKIFMQLGSTIDSFKSKDSNKSLDNIDNVSVSSFGSTEVMMMLMLLFLSLLCELAINQFSPKVSVSRKMLSQFSQYFPKDFDINKFMLEVVYEERDYDNITDKELLAQIKYCNKRINFKNKALGLAQESKPKETVKTQTVSRLEPTPKAEPKPVQTPQVVVKPIEPVEDDIKNSKIESLIADIRGELDDRNSDNSNS